MWTLLDRAPYAATFVASGVVTAGLVWRHARRIGWSAETCAVVVAGVLVGATAGASFLPVHGTIPSYGEKSVLGAIVGVAVVLSLVGWRLRLGTAVFDAALPAGPIGIAILRFGCFLAGCCFGTPTSSRWGVSYPSGSLAYRELNVAGLVPSGAAATPPLHPVQLYDGVGCLLAGALAVALRRRFRTRLAAPLVFSAAYGAVRFATEFLRYEGIPVAGLKPVQWALLGIIPALALALLFAERFARGPRRAAPAPETEGVVLILGVGAIGAVPLASPLERLCFAAAAIVLAAALAYARGVRPSTGMPAGTSGARLVPLGALLLFQGGAPKAGEGWRSWYTVGAGLGAAEFETIERDCEGNPVSSRDNTATVVGVDVARRWQGSRDAGVGIGVGGVFGQHRAGAAQRGAGGNVQGDAPYTTNINGVQVWTDLDSRWFGMSIGYATGSFPKINGDASQVAGASYLFHGGIRIGPPSRFFVELRTPTPPTVFLPVDNAHVGVGFATDSGGSNIRFGFSDVGGYAAFHGVVDGSWEIDPSVGFGGSNGAIRVTLRKRFPVP